MVRLAFLTIALAMPAASFDQDATANWKIDQQDTIRKNFSVSSGSNAKKVLVDDIHGFIRVTGYSGQEVQVVARQRIRAESNEALADARRDVKLDMTQQGNFVRLYVDGPFRSQNGTNYRGSRFYGYEVSYDFELQVPYATELILSTVNRGDIHVKHTASDFQVRNVNGAIELEEMEGSGSVHTVNGAVKVGFAKNPTHASEFKTLNGEMDIYFKPNLSADLRFKTFNGHVYTDFDVTASPIAAAAPENRNGRFVYRQHGMTGGRAGQGGPELTFDCFNGNIRLHQ